MMLSSRSAVIGAVAFAALVLAGTHCAAPPESPPPAMPRIAGFDDPDAVPTATNVGQATDAGGAPTAAAAARADAPPPMLSLLEPGKEPRRALRYAFGPDGPKTVTVVEEIEARVEMAIGKQRQAQTQPKIRVTTRETRVPNAAPGRVRSAYLSIDVLRTPGAPESAYAQAKAAADAFRPLTASYTVSPRGVVSDVELDEAAFRRAAGLEYADTVCGCADAPNDLLPDEAVGVGARWRTTGRRPRALAETQETTTYTLMRLENDTATVSYATTFQADPHSLARPSPGFTLVREGLTGTIDGTVVIDLRAHVALTTATRHTIETGYVRKGNRQAPSVFTSVRSIVERDGGRP